MSLLGLATTPLPTSTTEALLHNYTTHPGDYLIVRLKAEPNKLFIAEVKSEVPLLLKITDTGKYSHYEPEQYEILAKDTERYQSLEHNSQYNLLVEYQRTHQRLYTGLGSLHAIIPGTLYEVVLSGGI